MTMFSANLQYFFYAILCFLLPSMLQAQSDSLTSQYSMKPNTPGVEADFLYNYYQQDGNNSSVEGGLGTQELTNNGVLLVTKINLDSINTVRASAGFDAYSSASTDRIDNVISSESSRDIRGFGTITYERTNPNKGQVFSLSAGGSSEYDYSSINGALHFTQQSRDGNRELTLGVKTMFDNWIIYTPTNASSIDRARLTNGNTHRNSYIGSLTYSQVLNQKTQLQFSVEYVQMEGLLSTPFHRVIFANDRVGIEKFPNSRIKIPVSVRAHLWLNENMVLRGFYRYYYDNFGIHAHSFSLETPYKINHAIVATPFFRYHTQTASDYFAPLRTIQDGSQEFYTSDYDLSAFNSFKYGLTLQWYPLKPFFKVSKLKATKTFIRAGRYHIDYGLNAFFLTTGLSFKW